MVQTTKFDFVINLKTGRALGLALPQSICCGPMKSSGYVLTLTYRSRSSQFGRAVLVVRHGLRVCLKYFRSGGAWPLRAGIRRPSALRK